MYKKHILLFINGLLLGGLSIAVPSAYYLGKYSSFNAKIQWEATAKACVLNSEALSKHIANLTGINQKG